MASSSFRDSMNSLGWSRREQTATTSKPSGVYGTLSKLNPFNSEGYVRLPVTENEEAPGAPLPARTRREEEEGWFARKSHSSYLHTLPAILHYAFRSLAGSRSIIDLTCVGCTLITWLRGLGEAQGYASHPTLRFCAACWLALPGSKKKA
jgi:hypothetical protein